MNHYLIQNRPQIPTQREPDGNATLENKAGGYVYETSIWTFAKRFLVLGSEGGTYYTGQKDLTKENVKNLQECIKKDGMKTVELIMEMRDRVPKRDPILYALALAFSEGDKETKARIHSEAFLNVVRTGSDLLMFVGFIDEMRGWGRSLRRLVASWYVDLFGSPDMKDRLTYQLLKYQNRNGWTHKRVLRRAHVGVENNNFGRDVNHGLLRWVIGENTESRRVYRKESDTYNDYAKTGFRPELIQNYDVLKNATTKQDVVKLIENDGFTHEMIPTKWKNDPEVWEALLQRMPLIATIRNLAKMTQIGLIAPFSVASKVITERINKEYIQNTRVHPIQLLMARLTYSSGESVRGKLKWEPVESVVDVLEAGFYHAFANCEPTGKNTLLAIDISGSMGYEELSGCVGLTPALAAACQAMVFARIEPNYHIIGFDSQVRSFSLNKDTNLQGVHDIIFKNWGDATDCALPMMYATNRELNVEAFVILTDNVSWYGSVHPTQAFNRYQEIRGGEAGKYKKGSPSHIAKLNASRAKLAVVSMTATNETIGDPDNPFMLDVVGFDSAIPQLVSDFISDDKENAT